MERNASSSEKLAAFFRFLIRNSFRQLGVGEPEIADYVGSLLAEFSHVDRWLPLRDAGGRRLTSVAEMLLARGALDEREHVMMERALRKYIGDYTLFMSGLFREFTERQGWLEYYFEEGKRSYETVSRLDVSLYRPGFLVFEELSRGFERYAGTLDYMRKCCFASEQQAQVSGFLRRIEGVLASGRSNN